MSGRECIRVSVKASLIDPSGKVVKVIEGEASDPFTYNITNIISGTINGPIEGLDLFDVFGRSYSFGLVTRNPPSPWGYLIPGFCLTNCPNVGSTPPNSPGIWLLNGVPHFYNINNWNTYLYDPSARPSFITGLSYSPLTILQTRSTPSSPGDIVYYLIYVTQSVTNTLSSPVDVQTIVLAGAVYGSLSASPVYVPITFYVFSSPIVLSPGVTMIVSVTLSIPYGIAIEYSP
jgi:hypothetical protein